MKKILAVFGLLAAFTLPVFAGESQPALADYSKNPISKAPVVIDPGCPCFDGSIEVGTFFTAIFPAGGGDEHELDDSVGGGISLAHWMNPNLGLDFSAAWYGNSSAVHNYTLDVVYRFVNRDACVAPYVLGGGGVHTNGSTVGLYRVGAGVDVRFDAWSCAGVFADGIYTWTADSVQDYTVARVGVRIPF